MQHLQYHFPNKSNLNRPNKNFHFKLDGKTCSVCKKEFYRTDKFNDHIKMCNKRKAKDSGARDSNR